MKIALFATSALLVAAAAPALAQDTTAPVDGPSFTGPRAEIFGGWDRVGTRTRFDDGTTRVTNKSHKDGATAGALLGYDMPIGDKMTAGVFGSYALSTAKQCTDFAGAGAGCLKAGREIEGGARLGYKMGGRSLLYVKGAYVNGQVRGTFSDGTDYLKGHANRDGWRAGAGAEYALNKHAYVKVEYDYTRFNSFHGDEIGLPATNVRFDRNQVLGGFGIHF